MTNPINDIAAHIRRVDGGNRMGPAELGWAIQEFVDQGREKPLGADVPLFVERINPDKTMGAGALAEAIVAEFGLDPEEEA